MRYRVIRKNDEVEVLLLRNKGTTTYSFVNLTKGHICPCKFDSIEDAIKDMEEDDNIIDYVRIE